MVQVNTMQTGKLDQRVSEPLDEATHRALDEAEAALEHGEIVTLEKSIAKARERYKGSQ